MGQMYQSKHKGKDIDVLVSAIPDHEERIAKNEENIDYLDKTKANTSEIPKSIEDLEGWDTIPVVSGVGKKTEDGGEIFNDYDNNQAISPFATSTGTDNLSGSRAFTILALDPENKTYTLDGVEGLEVGDVYSVHLDPQRENLGKITAIDTATNTVAVDVFFGEDEPNVRHQWSESPEPVLNTNEAGEVDNGIDADGFDHEKNTFRIPAKPLVGTRKIGCATTTIGYGNQALSKGAFSGGSENVSEGSYSTTLGWQNLAAFCSLAQGIFNKIKGFWSAGFGYDVRSTADVTFGAGEGLRLYSRNQAALGMYNEIDEKGKYLLMLGNGEHNMARSNAATIEWNGNATFAGDVTTRDGMLASEKYVGSQDSKLRSELGFRDNGTLSPTMHRRIYRCKYLGDAVTDEQLAAIRNGSFDDLFIGDCWFINGVTWRIVDIDYWYNAGTLNHHLVIMPDTSIGNSLWMYEGVTSTNSGGYVGSELRKSGLAGIKEIVSSAFGDKVLGHTEYLINGVSNGKPVGYSKYNCTVELPSEIMMYGTNIMSSSGGPTFSRQQLALFNISPRWILNGDTYWLRDAVGTYDFACVYHDGAPCSWGAYGLARIRPVFCIG